VSRPGATWSALFNAIRALTRPPADVESCDRRVSAIASGSMIGRACGAAVSAWRTASAGSQAVAVFRRSLDPLIAGSLRDRVRAVAVVAAVAAVTTLLLRVFSTEHDPYTWALPAAVAAVALGALALADPLARAIRSFRS
jgi:hypothetical protein